MPPKPNEENRTLAFYNIDFSLANQVKTFFLAFNFILCISTTYILLYIFM